MKYEEIKDGVVDEVEYIGRTEILSGEYHNKLLRGKGGGELFLVVESYDSCNCSENYVVVKLCRGVSWAPTYENKFTLVPSGVGVKLVQE